jgi:hypothetical protein
MARPATLYKSFDDELTTSLALLDTVRALRFPASANRRFTALPYFQVALVAELVFLRCFLAWEVFLEEVFISYLMGAPSRDGTTYVTYVAAPSASHARSMVIGERGAFSAWSDGRQVRARANLFFDAGEPFDNGLSTISTALSDMVIVRNRIAHRSGRALERFLGLVRQTHGSVPRGMSAGRFLLAPGASPTTTRLEEYVVVLRGASQLIVP